MILHRRYVNRLFRGVKRLLEGSVNDFTYSIYTEGGGWGYVQRTALLI